MNTKLKAFIALAAIAIALIPQAEAQNTNVIPGTSSKFQAPSIRRREDALADWPEKNQVPIWVVKIS